MRKLFFILFFIASQPGWAQITKTKLVLLDKESGKPVSYATIVSISSINGTYSDERGICEINSGDSVLVKHVSYHDFYYKGELTNDTVFLQPNANYLAPVTVYASNNNSNKKFRFKKKNKLHLTLQSFEIGTIVACNPGVSNVYIPFIAPKSPAKIALKIYSIHENLPDKVIYREIHEISESSGINYISFNQGNLQEYCLKESIFISVELLSSNESVPDAIKLFLDFQEPMIKSFASRSFDINKKWSMPIGSQQIANLILFTE